MKMDYDTSSVSSGYEYDRGRAFNNDYRTILTFLNGGEVEVLGTFENLTKKPEAFRFDTRFESIDGFQSYLFLKGKVGRSARDQSDDDEPIHPITIRLSSVAFSKPYTLKPVTDIAALPDALQGMPTVQLAAQENRLHTLDIEFNTSLVRSAGLHTDFQTADPVAVTLLQKAFGEVGKAILYMRGGADAVQAEATRLTRKLHQDKVSDPISRWHRKHPTQHFVQIGDVTARENRPQVKHVPQVVFSTFGEYSTVIGYGIVQEMEELERKAQSLRSSKVNMRTMAIPGLGNRRYYGFLDLQHTKARLLPGDAVTINPDPKDVRENDWRAIVIESLPIAPIGSTTVLLFRPTTEDPVSGTTVFVDTPLPALPFTLHTDAQGREALLAADPFPVTMSWLLSDKPTTKQIAALRQLDLSENDLQQTFKEVLTGTLVKGVKYVDIYRDVREDVLKFYTCSLILTLSQRRAMNWARKLPNGFGLFTGPPGTGKTHFICQSMLPLLQARLKSGQTGKILVLSPSNDPVDRTAQSLLQAVSEAGLSDKVIIRMHSWTTEQEIIRRQEHQHMQNRLAPVSMIDESPELALMLSQYATASYLLEFYKASTHRPQGVNDKRVKLIDMSLGTWMFKFAGIIPGFSHPNQGDWTSFVQGYNAYTRGEYEDHKEEILKLRAMYRALRDHVVQNADVIVATTTAASETSLTENFKPQVIYIDEAAKATEGDLLIPLSHYTTPHAILLLGDKAQLPPTILTHNEVDDEGNAINCFAGQLRKSPFVRLRQLGHRAIFFQEQFRMVQGLADLPFQLFYNGKLQYGHGTLLADRPLAQSFLKWMKEVFPDVERSAPRLLINIRKGMGSERLPNKSTYNLESAAVTINVLISLLNNGTNPSDVAIIVPYEAQYQIMRTAMRLYQADYTHLHIEKVSVKKIDGYQGGEAPYVILDLVTTQRLGFLQSRSRVNVAMTRVKDGLVVIADAEGLEKAASRIRSRGKHIISFISDFKKTSQVQDIKATENWAVSTYIRGT